MPKRQMTVEAKKLIPTIRKPKNFKKQPPVDFRTLDKSLYFSDDDDISETNDEWKELGRNYVEYLNKTTPDWIFFGLKLEGTKRQSITTGVVPVKLGNAIVKEYHFVLYPELLQGAVYVPRLGCWRILKGTKDELGKYISSIITIKLNKYDTWDRHTYSETLLYTKTILYDDKKIHSPFDNSNPNLIAFANGTYDLRDDNLHEKRLENYIINAHDYDLVTTGQKTPYTDDWLKELFGDRYEFMVQFIGYMFYRSYNFSNIIVILQSDGGHGKSFFLNRVKEMIGQGNYSNMSIKQLTGDSEFNTSALYQKDLNYFADIGDEFMKSTETIKSLSGDDDFSIQFKGSDSFTFHNHAKLLFSANKLPAFKPDDTGVNRRIRVVPVMSKVADKAFRDRHPVDKIEAEQSAFVYKALRSFKHAKDTIDGNTWGLDNKTIAKATSDWISENDNVYLWTQDEVLGDDHTDLFSNGYARPAKCYEQYKEWCESSGYNSLGKNNFYEALKKLKFPYEKKRETINGKEKNLYWFYVPNSFQNSN
ncbi:phage/plasmid primase, P4 family [Pediococcus inopinatus]|uniref:DNA primase family protein n=1 Tax=Pediococcus inopinatus TaxID=114090 RepID=UPI002A6AADE3|nr:phage/plasmid primase, P4 family [Pediococcus inopinatus]WPP09829.1 phage/plasmid primase, P4 family [Pediococcus inopinatus]